MYTVLPLLAMHGAELADRPPHAMYVILLVLAAIHCIVGTIAYSEISYSDFQKYNWKQKAWVSFISGPIVWAMGLCILFVKGLYHLHEIVMKNLE